MHSNKVYMYNLMSLALIVPHKIADTATMGHVGQTKWRPPFDQCGRKKIQNTCAAA